MIRPKLVSFRLQPCSHRFRTILVLPQPVPLRQADAADQLALVERFAGTSYAPRRRPGPQLVVRFEG
jgi:hypothetical protein